MGKNQEKQKEFRNPITDDITTAFKNRRSVYNPKYSIIFAQYSMDFAKCWCNLSCQQVVIAILINDYGTLSG